MTPLEPQDIIDLPGAPEAMRLAGNVPWHAIGEVDPRLRQVYAHCRTCQRRQAPTHYKADAPVPTCIGDPGMVLHPHQIVSDGRFYHLFWGRCQRCGHVTYAWSRTP